MKPFFNKDTQNWFMFSVFAWIPLYALTQLTFPNTMLPLGMLLLLPVVIATVAMARAVQIRVDQSVAMKEALEQETCLLCDSNDVEERAINGYRCQQCGYDTVFGQEKLSQLEQFRTLKQAIQMLEEGKAVLVDNKLSAIADYMPSSSKRPPSDGMEQAHLFIAEAYQMLQEFLQSYPHLLEIPVAAETIGEAAPYHRDGHFTYQPAHHKQKIEEAIENLNAFVSELHILQDNLREEILQPAV